MAKIQSHRDLLVWQKSMHLVESVYSLTKTFPDEERYRLVHQATRAAASVPANMPKAMHGVLGGITLTLSQSLVDLSWN